ncbi:MAG: glycosyltransferase [Bacteroidetes bacterium]|nr:MAG: glycosyltransferase [Bacteroidota bacterium]
MRVLQLIDSLDPGGAERVAVNLANGLANKIEASFLCTTRKEGILKKSIAKNVNYLFLKKDSIIDLKAIRRLNSYVKQQNIEIIHAHSTSFFLATIISLLSRKVKLVWHDHYGESDYLENRKFCVLRLCSRNFSQIFSVNKKLEGWAKINLRAKKVNYLTNFAVSGDVKASTTLKGEKGKRIISLANLRSQKDHFTLFNAFGFVINEYPDWTLHCVGKDFYDDYSIAVKAKIKELNLSDSVFLYDSKSDISNILRQSSIGVLSSRSEGLPIALLEYGLAGLPVVVSDVGDCAEVVENNKSGIVVPKEDSEVLATGLLHLIFDNEKAKVYGRNLKLRVEEEYSQSKYITNLVNMYNSV